MWNSLQRLDTEFGILKSIGRLFRVLSFIRKWPLQDCKRVVNIFNWFANGGYINKKKNWKLSARKVMLSGMLHSSPTTPVWYEITTTAESILLLLITEFSKWCEAQNLIYLIWFFQSVGEHSTKKLDKPSVTGLPPETAKVEFFSSSLTVNNYNPTSTVKQSQSSVRIGGAPGHVRQLGTPCKTRDCAASPNMTASERFYQNKNDRCQ